MQVIGYTDSSQIRATLGIDEEDISDEDMLARNLDKELNLDLFSWLPNHESIAFTSEQEDALQLYATYFCAALVADSLKMAAPQSVSDGKNQLNRFSEASDWEKLKASLWSRAATYKKFLVDALGTPSVKTIKMFSGVAASYDPVTGQ